MKTTIEIVNQYNSNSSKWQNKEMTIMQIEKHNQKRWYSEEEMRIAFNKGKRDYSHELFEEDLR